MSSSIEYKKGAPCGIENCRATSYYEENGLIYCKEGHQQHVITSMLESFSHFLTIVIIRMCKKEGTMKMISFSKATKRGRKQRPRRKSLEVRPCALTY